MLASKSPPIFRTAAPTPTTGAVTLAVIPAPTEAIEDPTDCIFPLKVSRSLRASRNPLPLYLLKMENPRLVSVAMVHLLSTCSLVVAAVGVVFGLLFGQCGQLPRARIVLRLLREVVAFPRIGVDPRIREPQLADLLDQLRDRPREIGIVDRARDLLVGLPFGQLRRGGALQQRLDADPPRAR
ncbi:hypothetical protein [Nocardiopsis sp. YSL2]|uniref:hypothetical protein n=1 Tax=Nocardiopsis sp. YSL2 TaxID=2939492 RepID=UPI0026F43699|nr:hypothetical protein [Nocardiopsis sp. YSL2]